MDALRRTAVWAVVLALAPPALAAPARSRPRSRPPRAEALPRLGPAALTALARGVDGARLLDESPLGVPALRLPATPVGEALQLPATLPWTRARFLAMDALADGELSGELLVRFFARGESRAAAQRVARALPRSCPRASRCRSPRSTPRRSSCRARRAGSRPW